MAGEGERMILDGEKLLADIEQEIKWNEDEIRGAVKNCWYEKAARINTGNAWLRRVMEMIKTGDYEK